MESQHLDQLSRILATRTTPWSRRGIARLLAVFSVAGVMGVLPRLEEVEAKKKGKNGGKKGRGNHGGRNGSKKNNRTAPTPVSLPVPTPVDETCSPGLTRCGKICVDNNTELGHCGACNNLCDPGQVCRDGNCVAPPYHDPPSYCAMSAGACYPECFTSCDPFGDAPRGVCARLCRQECRCSPPPLPPWTCDKEDNTFNRNLCLVAHSLWQKACEEICAVLGGPVEDECKNGCKRIAEDSAKLCPADTISVC